MINHDFIVTDERTNRLMDLEDIIDRGIKTFIEVGEALLEIRDTELWRLSIYPDWEAYCKATWNFGKSRASQLISAAKRARKVQDVTGLTIPNERVARELNTLLGQYTESIQEIALDALAKRGGVLTQERLRNELDVLAEYKTTGHVTRADGQQSALDNAIKTGRKELETAKRRYIIQNESQSITAKHELLSAIEIDAIECDMNIFKDIKPGDKVHVSVWIEQEA